MDLWAHSQISTLDRIAEDNNIQCPRLRGYRLMRDEDPAIIDDASLLRIQINVIEELIEDSWGQNRTYGWTDWYDQKHHYLLYSPDCEGDEYANGIRWDRIHGKKKRMVQTRVRNQLRRCRQQYDTFNKYVGRDDILYIHTRIGGGNWPDYYKDVVDQAWFIEKVDDAFDSTYCDIYARIKPFTGDIDGVDMRGNNNEKDTNTI